MESLVLFCAGSIGIADYFVYLVHELFFVNQTPISFFKTYRFIDA